MSQAKAFARAQDQRIEEALSQGLTLRFNGHHFEESQRPRGAGPIYPPLAVLRAARAGRALIVTRGTETDGFEVEARATPTRSEQARRDFIR